MSPAICRMQKAHLGFLIICWTGFHDGTDKDFLKSAPDGVDTHSQKDSRKRVHDSSGQDNQQQEAGNNRGIRQYHGSPVTDLFDKRR